MISVKTTQGNYSSQVSDAFTGMNYCPDDVSEYRINRQINENKKSIT